MADLATVYDALFAHSDAAGSGLVDFGGHALNSLRLEKAYLSRFELTNDIGPRQAGVDRWLRADGGYLGADAVGDEPSGEDWKLVYLSIDVAPPGPEAPDAADCVGAEGVFVAGGDRAVGLTTSGGYGFTVEASLAFAYVHAEHAEIGNELDVLILGERRRAVVLDGPIWDENNRELLG